MKKDNKIKIVKVPLKTKSKDVFPNFPPMPVLYLELLENKDKIKPELRNKDYVPPVVEESLNKDQDTESIIYNDVINEFFTKLNDKSTKLPRSAANLELISSRKLDAVYSLSAITTVLDVPLATSYTPK